MMIAAKVIDVLSGEVIVEPKGTPEGYAPLEVVEKEKGRYFLVAELSVRCKEVLNKHIVQLEKKYGMTRVMREHIIKNPDGYSEFNVQRAMEIEQLAEMLRKK